MKLLSVDWDYFFPTPDDDPHGLYDWGHMESPFFMGPQVWISRDGAFRLMGQERPTVNNQWQSFWSRFDFSPDAKLYFGESHAWAVDQRIADAVTEVWSYDAHHDLGYSTVPYMEAMLDGKYQCDTWLVHYAKQGMPVKVRYPYWSRQQDHGSPKYGDVNVDIRTDLLGEETPTFDRVFVCRSGAWVPPWCDEAYSRFVAGCPVERRLDMGPQQGWSSQPRSYREEDVKEHVRQMEEIRGMMHAKTNIG